MEILVFIIAIIVLVSCINLIKGNNSYKEKVAKDDEQHLAFIQKHNITRSKEFIYNDVINHHYFWFIADQVKQEIFVTTEKTGDIFIPIKYSEIINAKIVINSSTHGEITRAIIGGAIAGTAGAIIGANTANSKVDSYKLVIERNNINNPTYEFILINKTESFDSIAYKNASNFAENVLSVLKVILHNNSQ